MALSDRIKEARLKSGLTQEQLASMIGTAKSTVTGYEKGNRIPPAATVGLIADATNVDVNFLYQDEVKEHKENNVSLEELSMIKKYRLISTHSPDGAVVVDTVLDRECTTAKKLEENKKRIEELENNIATEKKIANYPSHVSEDIQDYLIVQAAHNDAEIDEEELENMKSDIEQLKKLKNKK